LFLAPPAPGEEERPRLVHPFLKQPDRRANAEDSRPVRGTLARHRRCAPFRVGLRVVFIVRVYITDSFLPIPANAPHAGQKQNRRLPSWEPPAWRRLWRRSVIR
jgi:hypothetical protein